MDTPSDKPVDLGLGSDAVVNAPAGPDQTSPAPAPTVSPPPVSTAPAEVPTVENLVPPVVVVPEESKAKKAISGAAKIAPAVIGPMILAISLVYSFNKATSAPGSVNITSRAESQVTRNVTDQINIQPEVAARWSEILSSVPKNPDKVVATASAEGKVVQLVSGQSYSYPEVTFTWSGDEAVEPGTKIAGYYVYFGSKNKEAPYPFNGDSVWPSIDGIRVNSNSYTANNLAKGTPYYLFVQSVSDSKVLYHNLGMEEIAPNQAVQAKHLFIYNYQ